MARWREHNRICRRSCIGSGQRISSTHAHLRGGCPNCVVGATYHCRCKAVSYQAACHAMQPGARQLIRRVGVDPAALRAVSCHAGPRSLESRRVVRVASHASLCWVVLGWAVSCRTSRVGAWSHRVVRVVSCCAGWVDEFCCIVLHRVGSCRTSRVAPDCATRVTM
jgi:hypothetical protein